MKTECEFPEAKYAVSDGLRIRCMLCPHKCLLSEGQKGFCSVRTVAGGKLVTENAFRFTSAALDPVEKKPLYYFHPGSKILSLGSFGCNLACSFCQNAEISKEFQSVKPFFLSTEEIIDKAKELRRDGNIGIAFTYNEPVVWFETVLDIAQACRREGLATVMVTNGYIESEPLKELLPFIDAMNIDLKAFSESFYRKVTKGSLQPVLDTVSAAARKCHVEITTLIIPGLNDSIREMEEEAAFIASVDPGIPLHISRFFPRYRMKDAGPTPTETLFELKDTAKKHLLNVYVGNV